MAGRKGGREEGAGGTRDERSGRSGGAGNSSNRSTQGKKKAGFSLASLVLFLLCFAAASRETWRQEGSPKTWTQQQVRRGGRQEEGRALPQPRVSCEETAANTR